MGSTSGILRVLLGKYINSSINVGFEVLTAVAMKTVIFWNITECSPLKVNRRFGGTYCLLLQGRRISRARNKPESRCQAELCCCFSILKMEATCSSETSVDFQQTTRRYIPEDTTSRLMSESSFPPDKYVDLRWMK
jgi:hypothetical protein